MLSLGQLSWCLLLCSLVIGGSGIPLPAIAILGNSLAISPFSAYPLPQPAIIPELRELRERFEIVGIVEDGL